MTEVVSFEPDPTSFARLQRNVQVNGLTDSVAPFMMALGDRNGESWFTVGQDSVNHLLDSAPDGAGQRVRLARLDDVLEGRVPVAMKIDVEGHEEGVLRGAGRTLARPELLAIEIETLNRASEDILGAAGFTRLFYDPERRTLSPSAIVRMPSNNHLYVRDIDDLRERLAHGPVIDVFGWKV